ncbi:helix-turn-helix transcriptional regulator [Paenibacillus albicereus]|uniref:Helix-turn-helix transcriptional regulator n=1 Tax=Paenibacillus albicereus TaxID=2726185 RepID=A0A6H2GWZ9_9BACL|nr:helix-turn-helix domain-containing protein [Paenibacillus albicereus]QJC51925.1 helix-turn-helix transcriptional regulator [Paenibacillus albicereus]
MDKPTRDTCVPTGVKLGDTGFGYTLSLISGKYKIIVLYWLAENGIMRHNELQRSIGTISFKTLAVTLKELEAEGLVFRNEYPQIPPKVEYGLTERGRSLLPLLDLMCRWGEANRSDAPQEDGQPSRS